MILTVENEQAFVRYMRDTIGVTNPKTIHDAVSFARIWVMDGGYPEADNLWECFLKHSVTSKLTDHFETSQ